MGTFHPESLHIARKVLSSNISDPINQPINRWMIRKARYQRHFARGASNKPSKPYHKRHHPEHHPWDKVAPAPSLHDPVFTRGALNWLNALARHMGSKRQLSTLTDQQRSRFGSGFGLFGDK